MRQASAKKNGWTSQLSFNFTRLIASFALIASQASASLSPLSTRLYITKRLQLSPWNKHEPSRLLSRIDSAALYKIRGGSSEQDPPSIQGATYDYAAPQQQQQQQPPQMNTPPPFATGEFIDEGMGTTPGNTADPMYGYRETVEDRIDAWRKQQQVCVL